MPSTTRITRRDLIAVGARVRKAQREMERATRARDKAAKQALKAGHTIKDTSIALGVSRSTVERAAR